MLTPTTELKLIYWQSRLSLIAMFILLKLSYIIMRVGGIQALATAHTMAYQG